MPNALDSKRRTIVLACAAAMAGPAARAQDAPPGPQNRLDNAT